MRLTTQDTSKKAAVDLLIGLCVEGRKVDLPSAVSLAPGRPRGFRGEFRETWIGDAASGKTRVLLVGLGKAGDIDPERIRRAAGLSVKRAEAQGVASAAIAVAKSAEKGAGGAGEVGRALAEGATLGAYSYQKFKSKPRAAKLKRVQILGTAAALRRGVRDGKALAAAACFARDLQNAPGNKMRPRDMAAEARKLAARSPRIRAKIIDEKGMKALRMGALLGVAAGSSEPPRLIHLTYTPKGRARAKIAFVGKGLTFDAGGISLKPAGRMWDMKYDMSGGAAVLGVMHALASLDVPFEVHGIVPSSENLPDASAVKPGDVLTAMNGKTIEVLNTDAEGRLILCDALSYVAKKVKPDTVVDLATLTGAVVVALGHELTGMFTDSKKLRDDLLRAGEESGEPVWHLPLFDYHRDQMKGEVADLRNINSPDQGNGSTSGAAFLAHFVGDFEWAHLDIAGTAWGGRDRDYVGGGRGSGVGVRLLMRYLENRS